MLKKGTPDIQALNDPQPLGPQSQQNRPGKTLCEVFAQEAQEKQNAPKAILRIRPTTDEERLNKTERQWLAVLRTRKHAWLGIQAITFKLGDDCRYTPDFAAITEEGELVLWEVKGFMRDDAQVKLKTAARQIRWARFFLVRKIRGEFSESEVRC